MYTVRNNPNDEAPIEVGTALGVATDARAVCAAAAVVGGARIAETKWLWFASLTLLITLCIHIMHGRSVLRLKTALRTRIWFVLVLSLLALLSAILAQRSLAGLRGPAPRLWEGTLTVVTDPQRRIGGLGFDARVDGRRVLVSASGPAAWRLEHADAGNRVVAQGRLRPIPSPMRTWMVARHLSARLTITKVHSVRPGSVASRGANAIRSLLFRSASVLSRDERALFSGFVLGDDREQRPEVADDFRASGLSHLLVVSGQNVAFVVALVAPIARRRRLWVAFALNASIVVLFAFVTRFEPSVLRAATMAVLAGLARTLGSPQRSIRILALSVLLLVLIDPLLVWSVGFGLSVGACVGLALFTGPIDRLLLGPQWLRALVSTTLAAQAGTAVIFLPLFGGSSGISPIANALALPVAGAVMMWGLGAGLVTGLLGPMTATVAHLPTGLALRWVAGVARVTAQVPVGKVGMIATVAVVASALGCSLVRDGRRRRKVFCASLVLAIGAPAALASLRSVDRENVGLRRGAYAVGVRGAAQRQADVVVLAHGADAGDVLESLRVQRVRSIGLLVVASGGRPQAAVVRAIGDRLSVGGVLVADVQLSAGLPRLRAVDGMRVRSGSSVVTVEKVEGLRLRVTVEAVASRFDESRQPVGRVGPR